MRKSNFNILVRLLCLIAITLYSHIALAQDTSREHERSRWWINICTGEFSVNVKKASLWVVRYSLLPFTLAIPGNNNFHPSYSDYGLLIGDEWSNRWLSASAAAGFALTRVTIQTGTRQEGPNTYPIPTEFHTAGLAFEAHAVTTPLSFLGLGIGFFGNLNPKKSFSQVVLTFRLGNL